MNPIGSVLKHPASKTGGSHSNTLSTLQLDSPKKTIAARLCQCDQ